MGSLTMLYYWSDMIIKKDLKSKTFGEKLGGYWAMVGLMKLNMQDSAAELSLPIFLSKHKTLRIAFKINKKITH